jgi:FeS assembly protein SufD
MNIQPKNLDEAERLAKDASAQLLAHFRAAGDELPGARHAWIRKLRDDAMAIFAERGLPHRRIEEWKYTDLRAAMPQAFAPASAAFGAAVDADALLGSLATVSRLKMVFVNGRLRNPIAGDLPAGLRLISLAEAMDEAPEWLAAALSRSRGAEDEAVSLLNTAFATDGVALRVGRDVKLEEPIHLIHLAAGDQPASSALRNLVVLEEGAEATLIETYISAGPTAAQVTSATEIVVGDGGKLRHYTVAAENIQTQHLANTLTRVGAGADYLAVQFAIGGKLSRLQTFVTYDGEGSRAHFYGCQLMRGRQHCDMTLVIDHAAVGCESREHVKAVLDDHARGVFQAKVIVRPGAQQTDGRQMAQSLLLSDTAEFDAKPELEIYADDVKCNHGATTGAIDGDLLFYLMARGIPETQARALLIQAFIGEILDRIEHEGLRQALEAKATEWLLPQG